jgi:hypothetical protein
MPSTINVSWASCRPYIRVDEVSGNLNNPGTLRSGLNITEQLQRDWFPFVMAKNSPSEVFPAATGQPQNGIQNEYRNKGYWYFGPGDEIGASRARNNHLFNTVNNQTDVNNNATTLSNWGPPGNAWAGAGITNTAVGNGSTTLNTRYFTLSIPLYFKDPVILTNVSVFGAQEHAYAHYNSYIDTGTGPTNFTCQINPADGYKNNVVGPLDSYDSVQPNDTPANCFEFQAPESNISNAPIAAQDYLPAAVGWERPGELATYTQRALGDATIQILLDDQSLPENAELSHIIYSQTNLGDQAWRFNRIPNTSNFGVNGFGVQVLGSDSGERFTDMEPRFAGGPTWGTWVKQDNLNIPIPAESRVRFCVTVKGIRPSFVFDWHLALTVLEQTK